MAAYLIGHITVKDPDLWQEYTAMRISVSSWATKAADVEQSLDAIIRIAAEEEAA